MTQANICIILTIVCYLIVVVAIGIKYSKANETTADFYLGGRKLGPLVTAMSAEASDMSSYLLMGLPGLAYLTGLADVGWTVIGLAVGTYLNWLIVAKKLRRYSEINHSITIPDFFSNRYRDSSRSLMGISALIIIVFFIPYTASGFAACGKLFASIFGVEYFTAMLISAVVIVAYTALGGFLAASTTDLIQSIVMTIALVIVLIFGVTMAGGWSAVAENASQLPGYLSFSATYDPATGAAAPYGLLSKASMLAWGLGYFGMPHVLLRFMAIKDDRKLKTSRRIATVWVVISMAIAVLIGIIGYSLSKNGSIAALTGSDSETVIIKIAGFLSQYGVLAAVMAGVILAGILACTMSTADSQLLAASSSVSNNILQSVFGIQMSEKKRMIAARLTVIIIAVIAVFIARDPNSSVFGIVSFAWAGFGASFGPVMLLALFWKRSNRNGALAGMISGGAMVFLWKYGISQLGGVFGIYELLPAFLTAIVVNVLVSLATKEPSKEITEEFETVKNMA